MNKKILVIAAVAIVVVGAAGGAFYLMGGDDDKVDEDFDRASGALLIYGNVNGDGKLDNDDVTAIQKLIDEGKYSKLADANMDGKIDAEDTKVVRALIEGRATRAYYQDMTDGPTAVDFPVTSFMGIHQFVLIPMVAIGGLQYMKGYTMCRPESASMLQDLFDAHANVNVSYNTVDVEKLTSLPEKPKVIMTHFPSLANEAKLEKSGIQIIHMDFGDFEGSVSAIRTAGFLIGLNEGAGRYVGFIEGVINDAADKILSKVPLGERKTVICGYMTNCIDHGDGSYTPMAEAAGGRGLMSKGTNNYVEFNRGDEWILSYNEDMFFYMNMWGYSENIDTALQYKKSADYFTGLKSYKSGNFVVFNSVMPPALTVAYMAEAMYPDLVGTGYGDKTNQAFIDEFFPTFAAGCNVTDYDFVITYDMVKDRL